MLIGNIFLMGSIKKTLAENIARLMLRDNVTGAQIAKDLGVTQSAVSFWVSGKNWPNDRAIDALMKHYKWTHAELFAGQDSSLSDFVRQHNASNSPFFIGLK